MEKKMEKVILGIDPGSNGALAFYDQDELIIHDMPVYEITKGKTKRKKVDFDALCKIISGNLVNHAYVENVSAQFGNGASSAFTFGWGCACIENALIACRVPFTYVTPQVWKKALSCPKDKDGARLRASQLLPQFAHNWPLKKHDGRAESSLIALYGFNKG